MTFPEFLQKVTENASAGSVLAASVALTIFLVTRILDWRGERREKEATRKRLVIGFYLETLSNREELRAFRSNREFVDVVKRALQANPTLRPTVSITESTQYYDAMTPQLPSLERDAMLALWKAYDKIRELRACVDVFESLAFLTVSEGARLGAVDDVWAKLEQAETFSDAALTTLGKCYPADWFEGITPG